MAVTATVLRKELFKILDAVAQGEPATVIYKGTEIKLEAAASGSKLARLVKRDTLLVDDDAIISTDPELMKKWEAEWEEEAKLL